MLMKYLFIGETLLCEYLQQWRCVAVSPLEHFSDYRQKVPDALRLASSQRSQQTCPLGSSRRLRGRQVHGVYITVNAINKYSTRATVIYGLLAATFFTRLNYDAANLFTNFFIYEVHTASD